MFEPDPSALRLGIRSLGSPLEHLAERLLCSDVRPVEMMFAPIGKAPSLFNLPRFAFLYHSFITRFLLRLALPNQMIWQCTLDIGQKSHRKELNKDTLRLTRGELAETRRAER
jgi:hypothetical protein